MCRLRHHSRQTASPGVIVVPQSLAVVTVLEELVLIWAASQAEEWTDRIVYLPL